MRGKRIFAIATLAIVFASLFAIPAPVLAQEPRMYITPSVINTDAPLTFTVEVWVENVYDMYAFEFKVKHNVYYLTFLKPPKEGPFLKTGGDTYFAWTYNAQAGVITVGATLVGEIPGVEGTGKIAELSFRAEVLGAGKTTLLDLYDELKLDSYLQPIPELPPGDCSVTINWPSWLLNAELWLSSAHGGKIWSEWQTAKLIPGPATVFFDPNSPYYWPDPYWLDYPLMWPAQTIYARVRNTGTAGGFFIRVRVRVSDPKVSGWAQWRFSMPGTIGAKSDAVVETKAGPVDLYIGLFYPWEDFQQWPATWLAIGRLQFSLDGFNFFYWDQVIIGGQHLPGDGWSRATPGGDTGKFKLLPP